MSDVQGIAGANDPTGTSNCTRYQEVSVARSRDCFGISNKRSWLSWSNNAHGTQHIRRESGRWSQWFNHYADEIEYKPSWRIFRELRSRSVWDVYHRNTAMAKVTCVNGNKFPQQCVVPTEPKGHYAKLFGTACGHYINSNLSHSPTIAMVYDNMAY